MDSAGPGSVGVGSEGPSLPKRTKHRWELSATMKSGEKPTVEQTGVPQGVYLHWIKAQLDSESACLELPITIMLMVAFSMLAILHLRQDIVLSVESAIEQDIIENANFAFSHYFGHKSIWDVHSFADYWSWLRLGFIPLVVQPSWSYSESYSDSVAALFSGNAMVEADPASAWNFSAFGNVVNPVPIKGDYLHYNRIIGGLRFRQQLSEVGDEYCKFPSTGTVTGWSRWYGKPCMPAWAELPFQPDTMVTETFSDPARVEFMLVDVMSVDDMRAMAVDMEDGCAQLERKGRPGNCYCEWCAAQDPPSPWLTEQTQRLELGMITLNSEYGLITRTLVNFFFNRGSYIHKRVEVMSTWMDPWSGTWEEVIPMLICDVTWVVMLLYILKNELQEIVHVLRVGEGPRWWNSLYDDYIAFWNVVDWISLVVSGVVVLLFVQLHQYTTGMHSTFQVLINSSVESVGRDRYKAVVIDFWTSVEQASDQEKVFRMSLCVYPMMIMLRLFKSFAAQPRLAVVTATLVEASQDIFHFFIVFFGVLFCLCLNSVMLFGQDLEEFGTFARAVHSCFRMMFGDWDWEPIQRVRRSVAMAWFSMFMLLMVVILLNMLLAIIMDNYMKVKKRSSDATTLVAQMQEMVRRRRQLKRKERVRLNDIYDTFAKSEPNEKEMLRSKQLITPQYLLDTVPGIQMTQARRTLTNARDAHEKAHQPAFDISDMSKYDSLDDATRKIRDGLFYVQDRVDYYDTMRSQAPGQQTDTDTALANAMAAVSAAAHNDSAVSSEVIEYIMSEIGRLSSEAANTLAQTVKTVDSRQSYLERRQEDMASSIREMHHTLLNLQSEASSLTNKLRRACHEREQASTGSKWRGGLRGKVVPGCLMDCSPGNAQEALLPRLSGK